MNTKIIRYRFRRLCALIIGIVFLLSGIVKLLDPVGAGLVVEEYFRFFHLGFLQPAAKAVGVAMALFEALLGAALISGIWRKTVAIVSTVLICFFTLLTLVLAIFNPDMECGCFGEVIHLTNLQSFLKNLVLLLLASFAFVPFRDFGENRKRKFVSFTIVALSLVAFGLYSLKNIPLVDYTAFTPGSVLMSARNSGETGSDDFMSTFIYEKNGQEGAFTLDKLPDSTWTFVRTETIKVNRNERKDNTPILSFTDSTGTYRDELAANGNVMAISVYEPEKVKGEVWTRISEVVKGADEAGFKPLLLMAGNGKTLGNLGSIVPDVLDILEPVSFFSDRKTLVSLNRSNGGATWFNDGELIQKFPAGNLPSDEQILKMTGYDPTESMLRSSSKGQIRFQGFLLYALAILLLL